MTRPKMSRRICYRPDAVYFKPRGVPMTSLKETMVMADELESLRLSDVNGLSQTAAARQMRISQPTFARILAAARRKVASAIVKGEAIRLDGQEKE